MPYIADPPVRGVEPEREREIAAGADITISDCEKLFGVGADVCKTADFPDVEPEPAPAADTTPEPEPEDPFKKWKYDTPTPDPVDIPCAPGLIRDAGGLCLPGDIVDCRNIGGQYINGQCITQTTTETEEEEYAGTTWESSPIAEIMAPVAPVEWSDVGEY